MADRKPMTFRFDVGLMGRVDAVRGSVSRTAWVEAACRVALGEGSGGAVCQDAGGVLPSGMGSSPGLASPRAPKPLRLAQASGALTSAQAKVGVKPIDWRSANA